MNGTTVVRKITSLASSSSSTLKQIGNPLWKILSFSPADERVYPLKNISVSLEKGKASFAYGSRFLSRMTLRQTRDFSFEEGRYPQPEVLASSVSLALNEFAAAKAEITLCIPKAWAVFKTAEFPLAVKENLPDVLSYELDRITPFSSENAWYDFRVVGETAEKITLFIVAAKADMINQYREAFMERGLQISRITVNLLCMEALSSYRDGKADSLFLEITKEGYEGALFLQHTVTNTFSGNFQTEDETIQADILMSEMQPLLDALKLSGKPERIQVLFRDRSTSLREILKSRIIHPLTVVNESDPKLKIPGETAHLPYAAVGGVLESLWPKRKNLNLLNKGRHAVQKTPVGLTAILLLCLLALWVLYILAPLQVEEKRIQEIDQQIMQRKEEVRKVEALKKEIENINKEIASIHNFKTGKPMAINILRELTTILPKTAWLTRLRISETKVEMEGYAGSATGILAKLESSPYFTKAEFASPTFRDTRLNADRFNIKMEIEGVQVEPPKPVKEEENEEE